jgi:hypothetical protein
MIYINLMQAKVQFGGITGLSIIQEAVRFEVFMAAKIYKIFSDSQPCQLVKIWATIPVPIIRISYMRLYGPLASRFEVPS